MPIFEHDFCGIWDLHTAEDMVNALAEDFKKSKITVEDAFKYIKIFTGLDFYENLSERIKEIYN